MSVARADVSELTSDFHVSAPETPLTIEFSVDAARTLRKAKWPNFENSGEASGCAVRLNGDKQSLKLIGLSQRNSFCKNSPGCGNAASATSNKGE
ncbi:hypothetical protein RvY_17885 [Ramazzottius varieornatus]|uniref:Uncharacterized protein n=1 Tax=Ramazzottius varieornatus TaxID=947166 RepID=A0A1D1W3T1_RAMVA|nr:hypothetical protein RvY_17885 [Ramazzottius varieornatus]